MDSQLEHLAQAGVATQTASPAPAPLVRGVRTTARVAAVGDLELAGHDGDLGLDAVVRTLCIGCRVPIAVVNLVTPDRQTYPAEVGVGAPCTNLPDDLSFCAEVVETGAALQVEDAALHPVYAANPLVRAGAIRSYAGEPLLHAGAVVGVVSMFDTVPRRHRRRARPAAGAGAAGRHRPEPPAGRPA